MVPTLTKSMTFDEFIEWKPDNECYELRNGVIVEMQPKGKHEEVTGFMIEELIFQVRTLNLPYFFPKQVLIKSPTEVNTAYLPDVLLVDHPELMLEPYWESAATLTRGQSIPLVVEVVSTNWRDDYLKKLADYEELGIQEYWIADYLGLGGLRFIGSPKQPTFSVCRLVDGEYQIRQFRENASIVSPTFPELNLTADQVLRAGR
jgi:Uma2 family endonuclease